MNELNPNDLKILYGHVPENLPIGDGPDKLMAPILDHFEQKSTKQKMGERIVRPPTHDKDLTNFNRKNRRKFLRDQDAFREERKEQREQKEENPDKIFPEKKPFEEIDIDKENISAEEKTRLKEIQSLLLKKPLDSALNIKDEKGEYGKDKYSEDDMDLLLPSDREHLRRMGEQLLTNFLTKVEPIDRSDYEDKSDPSIESKKEELKKKYRAMIAQDKIDQETRRLTLEKIELQEQEEFNRLAAEETKRLAERKKGIEEKLEMEILRLKTEIHPKLNNLLSGLIQLEDNVLTNFENLVTEGKSTENDTLQKDEALKEISRKKVEYSKLSDKIRNSNNQGELEEIAKQIKEDQAQIDALLRPKSSDTENEKGPWQKRIEGWKEKVTSKILTKKNVTGAAKVLSAVALVGAAGYGLEKVVTNMKSNLDSASPTPIEAPIPNTPIDSAKRSAYDTIQMPNTVPLDTEATKANPTVTPNPGTSAPGIVPPGAPGIAPEEKANPPLPDNLVKPEVNTEKQGGIFPNDKHYSLEESVKIANLTPEEKKEITEIMSRDSTEIFALGNTNVWERYKGEKAKSVIYFLNSSGGYRDLKKQPVGEYLNKLSFSSGLKQNDINAQETLEEFMFKANVIIMRKDAGRPK